MESPSGDREKPEAEDGGRVGMLMEELKICIIQEGGDRSAAVVQCEVWGMEVGELQMA